MSVHAQTLFTNRRYLDAVEDHVVIFDGAMGTSIQRYDLSAEDFGGERTNGMNDFLVIMRPDVIEEIHASFLAAGAEVVETDTFRSNPLTLAEFGLQERCIEINRAAAALARRVCDRFEAETGISRFVAGSMGPSGKLPSGTDPDLSNITFDELADLFYVQAQGLLEGGADVLLLETSQDILEVKAAVWGIQRAFADLGVRIPLQAQVTLDVSGRMLFGTDIASALATLQALPIDVIGLNCSTGPEYMAEPVKYLVEHSRLPISVLPNAGLPINVDGEAVYPMEPDPFSDMVAEFTRWGVGIVGGCCGTRPEHIRKLYEKVHGSTALTPQLPFHLGEGEETAADGIGSAENAGTPKTSPVPAQSTPLHLGEGPGVRAEVEYLRRGSADSEQYEKIASEAMVYVSRDLRQRETPGEKILWEALRNRRLAGLKFRRQHPVADLPYVVNFMCYETHLIVELDGPVHLQQQAEDIERQQALEGLGYRVIRFTNDEVFQNLKQVLKQIAKVALTPQPPLPGGEGEETAADGTGSAENAGTPKTSPALAQSTPLYLGEGPRVRAKAEGQGVRAKLRPAPIRHPATEPMVSSNMRATAMQQNPGPTMIGERVNTQGSRKVKQLMLDGDYDGVVPIAIQQVEAGAHMLDVCVALTERADEAEQMKALVKKLALAVEAPLIIDVTDPAVAEAALSVYPGRAIINGNNLENGRERIDQIMPVARKYGAGVLSMTIDEEGMAHTREHKLAVARRIRDIAVNDYGLAPEDLIFDTLTFPLTTGQEDLRNDAIETLEGIRLIKAALPGVMTALGVSNVSFGITPAARGVLNSVFLHHAVEAGLDMAIVNPAHITPYFEISEDQRKLANDLIFNSDIDALPRFIQYFEQNKVETTGREVENPTEGMTSEQALHWQIVHRKKDGVEARIDDCLTRQDAVGVLNNVLLPAMKEVGDKFGSGELILPFVLQSAEVMKKAVAYLEGFMDKVEGASKGTLVLATVYGDVHDIGKNLAKTILSNNGYTVHDLGKQVPANTIIDKALEYQADAIGLSALLVSTSKQMPLIVNELARRGLDIPVLIGGAAINRKFGRRILFLEGPNEPYAPGVFYCKDAFEGLSVMDKLTSSERAAFVAENEREAYEEMNKPAPVRRVRSQGEKTVPLAPIIPTPPFWGTRTIESMPLEIVLQYLHKPELYRLSWGAGNTHGAEWATLQAEYDARLERMTREALRDKSLLPQAVYGFFPAASDGDDLIIYDPALVARSQQPGAAPDLHEIARFSFPRQPFGEYLCLSDYTAPVGSVPVDVVALQVVTVGRAATEKFERLQAADLYTDAYFFHGLAVQAAEATANYVNRQLVAGGLGIPADQGKRYSWGYPACPDVSGHAVVRQLLPEALTKLGMELSPSYQWIPEESTAAIVMHHPDAKYFSVGADRVEQILGS